MNNYGMYTPAGERKVHQVVMNARAKGLSWPEVYTQLQDLALVKQTSEALDTVVREQVYSACGFTGAFYI
jgi:hypothetical protein